ncbi:uncharacterized protein LOC128991475 isoform X1 [Macrosteles quadrilineatus]|uniref:uncharacterized protein LOC128991475 isoform X1 n=1 Tax=Macrosteles quadrilineatus TaxID=74068 RepID=UPI0023E17CB3|nr:uncharacterized protein LOC128991475 isoform X1 [Macrosteles quadrilineatus]XP_054270373.1 uncharacterized protein LOC128991475 isoform X1 [Macrosteles quadrilineatus]XP_054270381.1 uncharacterized protein LOC128991475 isoform X1 [Macrosteles quadrilineatus]XP_054270389.1 uncharacterized protein LOC128991475 isoform X1 [Macrosteles quadrilineatus]
MAELENFKTTLKNISSSLHTLQKIVECPVCLDTIQIPFKTCSRGHGVCNCCCEKLKNCPTCEGPFIIENPVCLKNLLEALPRQCKYQEDGCLDILEPGSDHEEFCGFRPAECRKSDCNTVIPLIKLVDHYEKEHCDSIFNYKANSSNPWIWPQFDPKEFYTDHVLISVFDNIFWVTDSLSQNNFELTFEANPIGKLKNEYFLKVKIEKDEFLYVSTLKASVVKCSEKEGKSNSDVENNSMSIKQSALCDVINDDGNLLCEATFFERQK